MTLPSLRWHYNGFRAGAVAVTSPMRIGAYVHKKKKKKIYYYYLYDMTVKHHSKSVGTWRREIRDGSLELIIFFSSVILFWSSEVKQFQVS